MYRTVFLTLRSSLPATRTIATVISLPRNRTKVPTELMAATRNALETISMKAFCAPLQKLYPYIAVNIQKALKII